MTDRIQLRGAAGMSELKDIREINVDYTRSVTNRMTSFIQQGGNPYSFRVGSTAVEVEYGEKALRI